MAKDIRLLIADLIWEARTAWSERPVFDDTLQLLAAGELGADAEAV